MRHTCKAPANPPPPANWRAVSISFVLAGIMAAMADAGLEASTLFCLTDDTREMVDEVSERV